jgi:hypothetical protein
MDGKLLCVLPDWLTKSFPIDPKWVNHPGSFHLAQSASVFLEHAMLTQGSAKWVAESLYKNQNEYYKEREATYYSGEIYGVIFVDFPSLKESEGVEGSIPVIFGAVARACREGSKIEEYIVGHL